ncbi:unnamed protein product [Durusdinium trenchii]|uniref:UTP:RNA uridylyltransferase 1 n=2 Tax=Durusdinium trenchii TaxID=1381693 RepID=A0ABP0JR38_9DINO
MLRTKPPSALSFGLCRLCLLPQARSATQAPLAWVPPATNAGREQDEGRSNCSRAKDRGPSVRLRHLTCEVEELAARLLPTEEQLKHRDETVQELEHHLQAAIPGCNLVPFGSAATGLWVPGRDVDLSLKVAGVRGRIETKSVLHRVALTINRFSGEKPENRLSAKMPLLRWIPPTSWEKDGTGCDPSFDITVNNDLAVENSRLVSAYLAVEPLLKPMLLVIKTWASARHINDRSEGTLSSFALTLMTIHLFQRRHGLPSLQDLAILHGQPLHEVQEVDCRFCTDERIIEKEKLKLGSCENGSLGANILDFFKFFGTEYKGGVIAVRSAGKEPSRMSTKFLFIDNPFEPGKDVANVDIGQHLRLREEFRKAYVHLRKGNGIEELEKAVCLITQPGER